MSDILVTRKGRSISISPIFIELVSQYICQVMESNRLNTYSQEIQEMYIDFDSNRTGECLGFVTILFDDIVNGTDKSAMIKILDETKELIKSRNRNLGFAT